ncbi:hypothetical protein ACFQ2B_00800 [Streptomyces stramineus]
MSVANSDGLLLTGRLSLRTHPWLADHTVRGTVLLPGTAFLELAVRAGDETGCGRVEELTLAAPWSCPRRAVSRCRVWQPGRVRPPHLEHPLPPRRPRGAALDAARRRHPRRR